MTIDKRTELLQKVNSSKNYAEVIEELYLYVKMSSSYYFRSIVKIACMYNKFIKDREKGILHKRDILLIEDVLADEIIEIIIGIYEERSSIDETDSAIQNITQIIEKYWRIDEDDRLFEFQKFFNKNNSFFQKQLSYIISDRNARINKFTGDEENHKRNLLNSRLLALADKVLLEKNFIKNYGIKKLLSYDFIDKCINNFRIAHIESAFNHVEEFILLQRNYFYKELNFDKMLRLRKLDRQISKLALEYETSYQEQIIGATSTLTLYLKINSIVTRFFDALDEHIIDHGFELFDEISKADIVVDVEKQEQNFDYVKDINKAKELISNFEIKKVFKIFSDNEDKIPSEYRNDIILIKSRWNKNEKMKRIGVDYEPNYENIITYSLLEIIDEIVNSAANKGYDVHAS